MRWNFFVRICSKGIRNRSSEDKTCHQYRVNLAVSLSFLTGVLWNSGTNVLPSERCNLPWKFRSIPQKKNGGPSQILHCRTPVHVWDPEWDFQNISEWIAHHLCGGWNSELIEEPGDYLLQRTKKGREGKEKGKEKEKGKGNTIFTDLSKKWSFSFYYSVGRTALEWLS